MPLTSEQIAKIRQKEAATPDALKRNPLNDYTEGWFHVTLNVRGEAPVLGYIVGDAEAEDGRANAPRCVLTELGRMVEEVIASISSFHKYTIVEDSIVMPEHLHMLLHLLPGNKEHLGKVISGFMGGCTHAYWDVLSIDWRKDHPTQGKQIAANIKSSAAAHSLPDRDRDHTRSYRGPALMMHGYNDVEVLWHTAIRKMEFSFRILAKCVYLQRINKCCVGQISCPQESYHACHGSKLPWMFCSLTSASLSSAGA